MADGEIQAPQGAARALAALQDCTTSRPALEVVVVGYGLVVVLFVVFFAFEQAWWHHSRKHETVYIVIALMLVPATNVAATIRKRELCFYQSTSWELADGLFRQVLQLVLIFEMQRHTWPRMRSSFLETRPLCRRAANRDAGPPRHAGAVARKVEDMLADILSQSPALLPEDKLAPFIFVFLMAEQALWASGHRDKAVAATVFGYTAAGMLAVSVMHMFFRTARGSSQIRELEDTVRQLVVACDRDVLTHVLTEVSVATLFEVGGERIICLLTDFALERDALTLLSKAVIVSALQTRGIYFDAAGQRALARVVRSCRGTDLTALKNVIDGSGSYNNLFKLVYSDMSDGVPRREVLRHIKDQGALVRADCAGAFGVKLLSDLDDTLYCSGGKFPKGADRRFPKHTVYPGCLSLFKALDRDTHGRAEKMRHALGLEGEVSCNLVFLSARPHVYKDVAEDRTYRLFRSLVREERLHCLPTLIPGDLWAGACAMFMAPFFQSAWRQVGANKHLTYRKFRDLYPEYDFIFCGDNGQGDLYAAQLMLRTRKPVVASPKRSVGAAAFLGCEEEDRDLLSEPGSTTDDPRGAYTCDDSEEDLTAPATLSRHRVVADEVPGTCMIAALIHEVVPQDQAFAREQPAERGPDWAEGLLRQHLLFHSNYVGAALALHEQRPDLVTVEDVGAVARDAVRELEADRLAARGQQRTWRRAGRTLEHDLARAAKLLVAAGHQPPRSPVAVQNPTGLAGHLGTGVPNSSLAARRKDQCADAFVMEVATVEDDTNFNDAFPAQATKDAGFAPKVESGCVPHVDEDGSDDTSSSQDELSTVSGRDARDNSCQEATRRARCSPFVCEHE